MPFFSLPRQSGQGATIRHRWALLPPRLPQARPPPPLPPPLPRPPQRRQPPLPPPAAPRPAWGLRRRRG
ncbi:unnamed protein product [Closterium sp. NIES-53]